jgi:Flp pilus assembly protein TadB
MDTKTQNLIVGLFSLLLLLWLVMFAVPDLFINLFDTPLGNFILIAFIILAGMHNKLLGLGLASIFVILFRLSHN